MISRMILKEVAHYLLDFRFAFIFVLCAGLSLLSAYVGTKNYSRQLDQYHTVSEHNRGFIMKSLKGSEAEKMEPGIWDLLRLGILWNRQPEVLSPIVFGISGSAGSEANVKHQRLPLFSDSLFAIDPINGLLRILDLSFVVKVVLSLCTLVLTYDAVCGEKESGTLSLFASFPVPRWRLALAKLTGSTIVVLLPYAFAYLLACSVMALSSEVDLGGDDWARLAILFGLFGLYIGVFASLGLCVSAFTQRRATAFLVLLAVWAVWVFVVPNVALRAARHLAPVTSIYQLEKRIDGYRWDSLKSTRSEGNAFRQKKIEEVQRAAEADRSALQDRLREEIMKGLEQIEGRWDRELYTKVRNVRTERRNEMRRQRELTAILSGVSPFGAISFASMDFGRTGLLQHEKLEDAVSEYLEYMSAFITSKMHQPREERNLGDFSWFVYSEKEATSEVVARNAFGILNLALLAILGFAVAYVGILRYDMR